MSIKRHLFFYNTISVFTALVVMLLVSGVTTHFTAENYRRQSMASMDVTATIEVQELLQGEEIIRKDWPALDHQLRTRGYALTVTTQEGLYSPLWIRPRTGYTMRWARKRTGWRPPLSLSRVLIWSW